MSWRRMGIANKARSFIWRVIWGLKARYFWLAKRIFKGIVDVYNIITREVPHTVGFFSTYSDEVPHTVGFFSSTYTREIPIVASFFGSTYSDEVGGV